MKGIYTILNDKVYQINQNTAVPTSLTFRAPGVSTSLREDAYNKEAIMNVYVNTLKKPGTKSNKELYTEMKELIRSKCITEIPKIQNKYKIYVDYSILEDRKEVDHQAVMKPIDPLDKVYLLGVATNNETVYRRVKTFNPKLEFKTKNSLPFGITATPRQTYTFKINNIAVFEDFTSDPEVHNSIYDVSYPIGSKSIDSAISNMVQIYSTENAGIDIAPMTLNYIPRTIILDIEYIFAGLIVAYDTKEIDDLLKEIMEEKYEKDKDPGTVVPSDKDDPGILIPDKDDKTPADGHYCPNRDGWFDFYERATESNPKSLLVVENMIPDGSYDVTSMIKKKMVIKDIPDIEVGEYVIYRESLNVLL